MLIIVSDQPTASFFVMSGIIFIVCLALLLLLFLPKVHAMRKQKREKLEAAKSTEQQYGTAYRADSQDTIALLRKENAALKRQVKVLEGGEPGETEKTHDLGINGGQ